MWRSATLVIALLSSISCYGQNSAEYTACANSAQVQVEMNKCASQEAARADSDLNAIYQKLLAQFAGDQTAITKIKEAERAWIRFRDAYIDAMFPAADKQSAYGSEYPMDVNLLRTKLTREHQAALADLINHYQPTSH